MKKLYLLLIFLFFATQHLVAQQSTETFETELNNSTSFTDNGQLFNISSVAPAVFNIQTNYPNTGVSNSNVYIDNDGSVFANVPVEFTISSAGGVPFKLKSLYLYLANSNNTLNVTGTCTITGKISGGDVFSVVQSNPFTNSSAGFTLIDLATYGGSNNSNALIDSFVVKTTNTIAYVAMDSMTWEKIGVITTSGTPSALTSCSGVASSSPTSFNASGSGLSGNITVTAPTGFEVSLSSGSGFGGTVTLTQSSGTVASTTVYVRLSSSASGNPSGNVSLTSSGATQKNVAVSGTVTTISGTTVVTNIACFGGNTGAINLTPTGGTGPYTYDWGGGINTEDRTGLTAGNYSVTITDANSCTKVVNVTVTQPPALNGTTVVTNIACFGGNTGAINLTPTGGTGPYTYDWGGGINTEDRTGLTAGNYSVTITDANSCTKVVNVTVTQPAAVLSGTTVVTNVSCFGGNNGTINLTPTGGTGPYTYNWVGGATTEDRISLTAGSYSVTITDANGCTGTISGITVTQPASTVSGTTVVTNVACNGGTTGAINLTPTGGTGPYTYTWVGGFTAEDRTGLAAGNYSVTITDANSCTGTVNVTITEPTSLNLATGGSKSDVSCNGGANGTATVAPTGGTPGYTYSWNTTPVQTTATAMGLTAGNYTVTVTDAANCQATRSFTITQPTALSTIGSKTDVSCNGGANGTATVNPTGGTPGYTYSWNTTPVQTTATATGLAAGTYTVTVTDASNCQATRSITINQPAAITLSAGTVNNVSCNGGTNGSAQVIATGGTGTLNYSWAPSGGTASTASGLAPGTYTVTVIDANSCQATRNFTITQPTAITATTSKTDVLCNGSATGTATVTASGGTPSYTYVWSPSGGTAATATGLTVGNYSCVITDANGCSITKNFTINQPSLLGATTSQTNATCSTGGDASVTAFGGAGGYSYLWSPGGATTSGVTGLTAGSHSCVITDANGCTVTKNFVITTNNTLVASTFQTNILCNGTNTGSAGVIPSGAPGPYTYTWSPSGGNTDTATNLAAGTYSVLITASNGCSITKNFTITQPTALVASVGAQTNVSCNGGSNGSATVNVTGGTGSYTYSWAPTGGTAATATGLAAGTYTVTVTDANLCQKTQTFTITQPVALVAGIGAQTNVSCNGGSNGSATVAVTGGTGTYTYQWSPVGGTAATASGLVAGTYTVTVKDANNCQTTQSFTITQPSVLVATTSQTDVLCNGGATGTATVTASGGTPSYTYLWSPSGGTAATASGLTVGNYSCLITDANGCSITKNFTINQPTALSATTSQTNATCSTGGDASVTVFGGTPSYSYLWSPSGATTAAVTGLAAGNHSCLITDANGCTITKNFVISTTNTLVASTFQTNILCNGTNTGSAGVIPSGAPGPYTYTWSPSGGNADTATNLAAGTYSVLITASNGCSITKNFTITQPTALVASVGAQTNVSCNGGSNGSATVNATGGTGGYTYSWAPTGGTAATATGLAAGTYTVTVTDANLCQKTQTFTITQPAALVAGIGAQTNVSCNGGSNGSATVAVTGGTGTYTYQWSPVGGTAATASGLLAGTYTVTVKDANNCQTTQSFTITQPSILVATPLAQTNIACNGGATGYATVAVTGGTGTYTYVWSPTGGTAATASGLTAGTYTVTVKDANLCQTTQSFTITQPTVLVASASSQTNVSCNGGSNGSATVTATGGTMPYTYSWVPASGTSATITGKPAGTYVATVTDANGCTATQSFTITQPTALTATTTQTNVSCFGANNGSATVIVSGGTGTYTYSWNTTPVQTTATATGLSAGNYTVTVTDANSCTMTRNFTITGSSALTITPTQTNVSCNGGTNGTATVAVTGGTGTYTYLWSPSGGTAATATGLAPGNYSVTVTDGNGCIGSQSFTITQPTLLVLNGTSTNISCNGTSNGVATVTPTGGTAPYSYSWAPSGGTAATATGLSGGNYTVTVTDANGCVKTRSYTIYEQTPIVVTSVKTDLLCHGATTGTATVSATGGVPNYTYVWSNGAGSPTVTGLAAGTYTCTVSDALGCAVVHTVTITSPEAINVVVTQTNVSCSSNNDGAISLAVSGGVGPYTYQWTPASLGTTPTVSGLSAGNYSVTITDANGCTAVRNITVTQPQAITFTLAINNATCYGASNGTVDVTSVTGGTPPYIFGFDSANGGAPDPLYLAAGEYTATIYDASGCISTQNFTITQPNQILVTTQPQNVTTTAGSTVSYTTAAQNASNYQWQYSTNGIDWNNVTDGGTNPTYSGATTATLTLTNVPHTYNGYSYRVAAIAGANCMIYTNVATLNVENVLEAINDDFSATEILQTEGGIAGDVTANDLFNSQPVNDSDVTISVVDNDGLIGVTIDGDGNLIVPSNSTIGTYTITYSICDSTDLTNCSTAEAIVVVTGISGLDDLTKLELNLYPNPATTTVFIKIPGFENHRNMKLTIHDLNGRLIKQNFITSELQSVDVTGVESGIYLFRVTSDTSETTRRVVIDKKF
ncbi:T9SS type A sorting domain-containing protein [Flavobacterium sp. AG291]|uniref:T9SS type A sorting domain-containing protein n=1 Tax=Flavobacterium sp. AG291 TaxID=2184000 RepID=UPI000E0BCB9F|nr:T9SS type A sorting domain-containing protein [Flavobacterium sp. AG291]RDI14622.1 putative secreted protein (Por secretion system target) [Flavobacterium sp. AG291]